MEIIDSLKSAFTLQQVLIIAALGIFLFVLNFSKSSLVSPMGKGFHGIRLPLLKPDKIEAVIAFKNLVRGTLIVSGAGGGKTKSLIEPLIDQALIEGHAGIIYDFKFPTLASHVYRGSLLLHGSKLEIHYINFDDMSRTHRFNVFKNVGNSSYAREYATSLMMNLLPESIKRTDFFLRTATALLASSILYFSKREKEICTLPHIISFLLNPNIPKVVEILSQDMEAADIVAPVRSGLASEKQTAAVISTLQNLLSVCSTPKLFWVLSGDSFDLDLNNPNDPKLLVIGNKASLIESVSPVVSLIVTVAAKQMNEPGKAKSMILLDEGPTLFIPNFDTIPSTGRENKIATVFCAQDIAQMEERYGDKKAEVLMGNLANQFYGKISNPKTAEKVVKIFDKEEVVFESLSTNSSSGHTQSQSSGSSHSLQQRDRVTITHLRDLSPGEFVATTIGAKDFKIRFAEKNESQIPLPEISYVTDDMVSKNYLKIKNDVLRLF